MTRIGVLALQGDFARHARAFAEVGEATVEVRHVGELEGLDGLVIPGGESTALLRLMAHEPWFDGLRRFHSAGGALFGTCAGAILLAREVLDPRQPSLGLIDAVVRRNAFGRQVDSFETQLELVPAVRSADPARSSLGRAADPRAAKAERGIPRESPRRAAHRANSQRPLAAVFIRAPRFVEVGPRVEVLARLDGEPVLVRQHRVLAATFHPELTGDRRLQEMFLFMAREARRDVTHTSTETTASAHPGPVAQAQERRVPC
jgi:5'-phosphate synthase pdxT subunit